LFLIRAFPIRTHGIDPKGMSHLNIQGAILILIKVQKWGNSLAVRIPKPIALNAELKNNSIVDVSLINGQIIIKPVFAPVWSLEQLLSGVNASNIHHKAETGGAVGNEVW